MTQSISRLLLRRFGPGSECARRFFGSSDNRDFWENQDNRDYRDYYRAVVERLLVRWFGEKTASFSLEPFDRELPDSLFKDIPFPDAIEDHFGPLYQRLIPASRRRSLGEFYTPDWLADHLVRTVYETETTKGASPRFFRDSDRNSQQKKRGGLEIRPVLDPACGSGTFLLAVIRYWNSRGVAPASLRDKLFGCDVNPWAVFTARANLAVAFRERNVASHSLGVYDALSETDGDADSAAPFLPHFSPGEIETISSDSFNSFNSFTISRERVFPLILGNPPWINWDRLPPEDRERMKRLWNEYGLFNLSGKEARYGGAKKELAALVLLRVADRFLETGGRLAMVVPHSLFQTAHAGSGFRNFRIATSGTPLRILRVDDFSGVAVFSGVSTKTATLLLEKGKETEYPVPYFRWNSPKECVPLQARPIEKTQRNSVWTVEDPKPREQEKNVREIQVPSFSNTDRSGISAAKKNTTPALRNESASPYRAYLGANTGGANGVFWIEILGRGSGGKIAIRNVPGLGKKEIAQIETEIEPDLVFPLLRWKDVDRFHIADPTLAILLPQDLRKRRGIDVSEMESRFPSTFSYLKRFESQLRERSAYRKYLSGTPFYSLYNVGEQTVAPLKVVWRRMDSKIRAAVVAPFHHPILGTRPIVPQETTVLIPCDSKNEAEYLVRTLNSPAIEERVASFSPLGTKGFGSPGILQNLALKKYDPGCE